MLIRKIIALFSILSLVSCTDNNERVIAIVNGKKITIKELSSFKPNTEINQNNVTELLNELIQYEVIQYEAAKLNKSESELFSFFEILKNRKISDSEAQALLKNEYKHLFKTDSSKEEALKLIRQHQYEFARKKYIQELMDRSTVRIFEHQLDKSL